MVMGIDMTRCEGPQCDSMVDYVTISGRQIVGWCVEHVDLRPDMTTTERQQAEELQLGQDVVRAARDTRMDAESRTRDMASLRPYTLRRRVGSQTVSGCEIWLELSFERP